MSAGSSTLAPVGVPYSSRPSGSVDFDKSGVATLSGWMQVTRNLVDAVSSHKA